MVEGYSIEKDSLNRYFANLSLIEFNNNYHRFKSNDDPAVLYIDGPNVKTTNALKDEGINNDRLAIINNEDIWSPLSEKYNDAHFHHTDAGDYFAMPYTRQPFCCIWLDFNGTWCGSINDRKTSPQQTVELLFQNKDCFIMNGGHLWITVSINRRNHETFNKLKRKIFHNINLYANMYKFTIGEYYELPYNNKMLNVRTTIHY